MIWPKQRTYLRRASRNWFLKELIVESEWTWTNTARVYRYPICYSLIPIRTRIVSSAPNTSPSQRLGSVRHTYRLTTSDDLVSIKREPTCMIHSARQNDQSAWEPQFIHLFHNTSWTGIKLSEYNLPLQHLQLLFAVSYCHRSLLPSSWNTLRAEASDVWRKGCIKE